MAHLQDGYLTEELSGYLQPLSCRNAPTLSVRAYSAVDSRQEVFVPVWPRQRGNSWKLHPSTPRERWRMAGSSDAKMLVVVLLALSVASVSKVAAQTSEPKIGCKCRMCLNEKIGDGGAIWIGWTRAGGTASDMDRRGVLSISMMSVSADLPLGVDRKSNLIS